MRRANEVALPLACLVVTGLVVIAGFVGVDVVRDGPTYVAIAEGLKAGEGFDPVGVSDPAHFPPGLAIALVGLSGIGRSWTGTALLLNFVSWIAVLLAIDRLYRHFDGEDGWWRVSLLGWIAVGGVMAETATSVSSEPLYLATSLWLLVVGERWVRRPTLLSSLIVLALATASVATRYVGLALVAALVVRVLQERGGIRAIAVKLIVPASALVSMLWWYLANQSGLRSDAPTVSGAPVDGANVLHSFGALGSLIFGISYSKDDTILAAVVDPSVRVGLMVLGGIVAAVVALQLWRYVAAQRGRGDPDHAHQLRRSGSLLTLDYAALYLVMMIAWRIPAGYSILARYWLPVAVPIVALLGAAASRRPAAASSGLAAATAMVIVAGNLAVSLVYLAR